MKKKMSVLFCPWCVCMLFGSLVVSFFNAQRKKKNEGKQLISAAHFFLFGFLLLRANSREAIAWPSTPPHPHVTRSTPTSSFSIYLIHILFFAWFLNISLSLFFILFFYIHRCFFYFLQVRKILHKITSKKISYTKHLSSHIIPSMLLYRKCPHGVNIPHFEICKPSF
jgi:hypothetical protein